MYASGDGETETKRLRSEQQPSLFFFFLPEELIIEILSWVPAESLMRFKCVSKSWNSLISNPSFIQLHLHRSSLLPHRHLILLRNFNGKTTFAASYASVHTLTDFIQNPSFSSSDQHVFRLNARYSILGSCNGLVCLFHRKLDDEEYSHFLIWNPATGLVYHKLLTFRHAKFKNFNFGFGYDNLSDTYKLVSVGFDRFALKDSVRTQVKVYTFGSGSGSHCWREIQRFPEFPLKYEVEGIFLSGTLNWLAIRNYVTDPFYLNFDFDDVAIHRYVIVSLDLGTETYKQFSLPPFRRDEMARNRGYFNPVMQVFSDCLCLSYGENRTHFIMWQMKEFGVEKSWTRLVKVGYQYHLRIVAGPLRRMVPLFISDDVLILRTDINEIIVYNRRDNRVQLPPTISKGSLEIDVKGYAQSLISPC